MILIFCSDPMNKNAVDVDYEQEYSSAQSLGFMIKLICLEELLEGNLEKALSKISPNTENYVTALYRGWMIKPKYYEDLYNGLKKKNILLINDPEEYRNGHWLPNSYDKIKEFTPYSNWISIENLKNDWSQIYSNLSQFGNKSIIVKDYVKSRKHEWHESFYIPDASDRNHAAKVIKNFIDRQGDEINEGLVFREFVNLERISVHSKSQMPLSKEYRLFYFKNQFLYLFNYWEDSQYDEEIPDLEVFNRLAQTIGSSFFTMDIGKTFTGDWIVIEIGDGQVSGLPTDSNILEFYETIKERAD
ncbi:ATP-grasp domain-containing protein [Paenibacillus sp. PR3]|uniref:ATP-grasp domain-containing protein n=1 Tax=Paenibacillus terricola TaxID=2763503 RepID=A0ABR8N444_9BACL|nr:ATP-grasp domain-containing protein [Paenibacillus terricola]MBD3922938.1 ATP-grasp domain-containing protein [Paenibacillus terricola]